MTSANVRISRTKNRRSRLTALSLIWFLSDVKEHTPHFTKRVGDVDPSGVANLSWAGWVIYLERPYKNNLMIFLQVS